MGTERALQGHSEDIQELKALGYLGFQGTWVLGHSRHFGTSALKAFGHLGIWTLGHLGTFALVPSKGTWALRFSDTLAVEALEALYLADSLKNCTSPPLFKTARYRNAFLIRSLNVNFVAEFKVLTRSCIELFVH